MANNIDKTAANVVERFKQELKPEALKSLSSSDFELLTKLVKGAIASEREATAAQLETLAKGLKADIEYIDLGL
ncbi:MAG: hypothetical protein KDF59_09240 [Nitrosomonas sp.]|nr:hypothetical protein [Nitrosomonas sp.]